MAGGDTQHGAEPPGRERLAPTLQIPKNRSTGNLGTVADDDRAERPRIRFSFDAGAAAAEHDTMTRSDRRGERGGLRLFAEPNLFLCGPGRLQIPFRADLSPVLTHAVCLEVRS